MIVIVGFMAALEGPWWFELSIKGAKKIIYASCYAMQLQGEADFLRLPHRLEIIIWDGAGREYVISDRCGMTPKGRLI